MTLLKNIAFLLILCVFSSCLKMDIPVEKLRKTYGAEPSQFVPVMGMNVHYRDEGNDKLPAVLLLHGTGSSLHTWDKWAAEMSYEFRVLRLDLPAFGLTGPHPQGDYSMKMYREFINAFLEEMEVKTCHIAGNSLGGRIAWEYALEYPKKVRKLILIDAAGYPNPNSVPPKAFELAKSKGIKRSMVRWFLPRKMVKKSVEAAYGKPELVTKSLVDRYYDLTLREGNRQAFIDRMNHEDYDRSRRIKTIEQPVLIMWGTEDKTIPIEHASFFHRDLPKSTLKIYKDVGHVPQEEIPDETVQDALDFISYRKYDE